MIYKKSLNVIVVFLCGILVAVSSQASTSNYNFSYTASGVTITGVFLNVDNTSGVIGGITGTVSGASVGSFGGAISGLLSTNTFYTSNNNKLYPSSTPYLDMHGVAFYTGLNPNSSSNQFGIFYNGSYQFDNNNIDTISSNGIVTVSLVSGAPEIDGKFLPNVLLLLGGAAMIYRRHNRNQLAFKKPLISL